MAKKIKKKDLGLGIRALLSDMDAKPAEEQREVVKEMANVVANIPVAQIEANPFQPRTDFEAEALEELSTSIRTYGLIQPLTVRRMGDGKYQLISGERRLRAAKMAGLKEVPAYIRIVDGDQEMLEMALVENIQRADLNPLEVAITYQRLIEECKLTHDAMAERVGKKRSTITNFLSVLKLPPQIQEALKERKISLGHAKALRGVSDLALQLSLFNEILTKGLSVRATEDLVRSYTEPKAAPKKTKSALPDAYAEVQERLRMHLGTKVQLKVGAAGKGQIVIPFGSDDDLNRLLDLIEE
ncbi:MAG TPA: ParB/RepB/Spo0J family partition protein [Phaeodactylibacter sp.]|nr:ParB/RepB/Spo0J family partition protein [Phaeodactylibacter sp.]